MRSVNVGSSCPSWFAVQADVVADCAALFDLLAVAGVSTLTQPYRERHAILEELELGPHAEAVAAFDDGEALSPRGIER